LVDHSAVLFQGCNINKNFSTIGQNHFDGILIDSIPSNAIRKSKPFSWLSVSMISTPSDEVNSTAYDPIVLVVSAYIVRYG
jgi:hypothetical protein